MLECAHSYEWIPCPDICEDTQEHSHWRCEEGHGWIYYPGDPGVTWYDLTQPARCIYPNK